MHKTYNELILTPSDAYPHFIDFIFTLGFDAVEERENSIIVRSEDSMDMLLFALEEYRRRLSKSYNKEIFLDIRFEIKKSEDWISKYKNSIKPVSIGSFYIRPSWEDANPEKIDIRIDPALAFGSGHHETTSGCIEMLEKYLIKDDTLLDVGCGSGILSIVASKLGAKVDMCDTDELALESAIENFKINDVIYVDSWVGSLNKRTKEYDLVVANIIADILVMLSSDLRKSVKVNGYLILSGILDKYLDKVEDKFKDFDLLEKNKKNEWFTLVLKRR